MNLIPKPTTTNRFAVAESIYGFQVIDFDGRPVTDPLEWNTANQTRDDLNVAAYHGPRSLALALGCIDDEPEEDLARTTTQRSGSTRSATAATTRPAAP